MTEPREQATAYEEGGLTNFFPRLNFCTRASIVAAIWLVFAMMFGFELRGRPTIWKVAFNVPIMRQRFADLAQIPAAVQSTQRGIDPYLSNPSDVEHRPFLYPKPWLYLFRALRISPQQVTAAGLAVACCFLAAVSWLVLRQCDVLTSILLAAGAISGAAALAVERGNTDILILCLVVAAAELGRRGGLWLLVAAAVLKVYPVFAVLTETLSGRRRKLALLALIMAVLGIVAGRGAGAEGKMNNDVPHGYGVKEIDVGMEVAPPAIRRQFVAHRGWFRFGWQIVLLAVAMSGAAAGMKSGSGQEGLALDSSAAWFVPCASIFVGTFLVSTSYDYRLIFLIPMLPWLAFKARSRIADRPRRRLAATALALVVMGMNRGTLERASQLLGPLRWTTPFLKAASHADLWALLWIVCYFLGPMLVARRRSEDNAGNTTAPLHDRLFREHAS